MNIDILTKADLQTFREELLNDLKKIWDTQQHNAPNNSHCLKSADVKKILRISTPTLQHLRDTGAIPFTKIGGTIYYNQAEVNKLLKRIHSNHNN